MVTDDTGLSSDGTQTVSDDCTSFPELHPSLSLWGENAAQRQAALPSRCPQTTSARGDSRTTAPLSPRCRSIYLHLYDDLSRFFSLPPFPPQLSATLSEEGIQRSDNEIMTHPFQPFKSQPFYFPPILCCSFILNPFFIDLLIFSGSHASDAAEEAAGLVHLFAG